MTWICKNCESENPDTNEKCLICDSTRPQNTISDNPKIGSSVFSFFENSEKELSSFRFVGISEKDIRMLRMATGNFEAPKLISFDNKIIEGDSSDVLLCSWEVDERYARCDIEINEYYFRGSKPHKIIPYIDIFPSSKGSISINISKYTCKIEIILRAYCSSSANSTFTRIIEKPPK